MKLYLGVIKNKETGKVINHRSLLKILLNPFLRVVGVQINTIFDKPTQKILGYDLMFIKPQLNILYSLKCSWVYTPEFSIEVIKEHRYI